MQFVTTQSYSNVYVCYAENDGGTFKDTGLKISINRLFNTNWIPQMQLNWIHGSNIFKENEYNQYIEYELSFINPIPSSMSVYFDMLDYYYIRQGKLFPYGCDYYHPERIEDDCLIIKITDPLSKQGARDSLTYNTPFKVRIQWYDNGFPEIVNRTFYLVHTFSYIYSSNNYVYDIPILTVPFTLIDNDPIIGVCHFCF